MKNKKEIEAIKALKEISVDSYRLDFPWGCISKNKYNDGIYVSKLKNNSLHMIGCNDELKYIDEFITEAKKKK